MTVLLYPPEQPIRGTIALPLSKSESNRALIMQALSKGHIHLDRVSAAQDVQTMQRLLSEPESTLDAGPAGTTFRFLTAYFAITPGTRILTGSERLQQRPVGILVEALRHLGAQIEYLGHEGYPPLRITGQRLKGGTVDLDTSVSSQFLSALLMIAPTTRQGLTINLTGQSVSQPYSELTIRMMAHFGVEVARGDHSLFVAPQPYQAMDLKPEADWSAASYWYQIAAMAPEAEIFLPGLRTNSWQGDAIAQRLFRFFGVQTDSTADGIVLRKDPNARLPRNFEYDFTNYPDLVQSVAATCTALGIAGRFSGLASLRIKETDRVEALWHELTRLGALVEIQEEHALQLTAGPLHPPVEPIRTYEDHRMAMAFAPMCLAVGPLRLAHPEVVVKSYPEFWEHLLAVGFRKE